MFPSCFFVYYPVEERTLAWYVFLFLVMNLPCLHDRATGEGIKPIRVFIVPGEVLGFDLFVVVVPVTKLSGRASYLGGTIRGSNLPTFCLVIY